MIRSVKWLIFVRLNGRIPFGYLAILIISLQPYLVEPEKLPTFKNMVDI